MTVDLHTLFNKAKLKQDVALRLDEEYKIGDAARALHDTQKAVENFKTFLSQDFAKAYKALHMDSRNVEDGVYDILKSLEQYKEGLDLQIEALEEYLSDLHLYANPESVHNDGHRKYNND